MTPDEAPAGTVVVVGHPANGVTATKGTDGRWRTNGERRRILDPEDLQHGGARIIHTP